MSHTILPSRTELVYLDMYQTAMYGIKAHLIKQSPKRKLLHTGEIHPRMLRGVPRPMFLYVPKQDHLVCFLGGSYMLGALNVQEKKPRRQVIPRAYPPVLREFSDLAKEDWNVGHELIKTCVDTYTGTETGLSAEITMFRMPNDTYKGKEEDWYIKK
jgi:endoplasmic reticulum Man9GlcNAc2 1,2-alpha-mannosidase